MKINMAYVVGRALKSIRDKTILNTEDAAWAAKIESGAVLLSCEQIPLYAEKMNLPLEKCYIVVEKWLMAWKEGRWCKSCGRKPINPNNRFLCSSCSHKSISDFTPANGGSGKHQKKHATINSKRN